MRTHWKSYVAVIALIALIPATMPVSIAGMNPGPRLEGMVVGPDGTPAADCTVHLVVPGGDAVATATTDENGLYVFEGLEAGAYGLGVVTAEGVAAIVSAEPLELAGEQIVRRDIRLFAATEGLELDPNGNASLGVWWAGLGTAAKAGLIIAILAVAGYGATELFDDEEEDNPTPSGTPQ